MSPLSRRSLLATGLVAGTALSVVPGSLLAANAAVVPLNAQLTGYLDGLHDPVIIREGDTYHVFGSGGWWGKPGPSWRISTDLHAWTDNGSPFEAIPAWTQTAIPGATSMWAPDIHFVDGLFRLYYSVSTGGSMRSVTGFATSPTLDRRRPGYGWTDHGLVIESHEGGTYNVIDSNFVIDRSGDHWLAFGSYWSGLKIIALDKRTGKPKPGASPQSIAYRPAPTGGDNPVEGAFVFSRDGWYYLFASYDYCCKKEASNYYVAVGRSRAVAGPYVGRDGKPMMEGYGTGVIVERPWGSTNWRGPGHCGLMHDGDRDLIVYHAYDVAHGSQPTLRLAELTWTSDGWPVALT